MKQKAAEKANTHLKLDLSKRLQLRLICPCLSSVILFFPVITLVMSINVYQVQFTS